VMVHFHWDRYNDGDGKATCWIRVSQPWAGKGWGGYFMPRIGQEVIVEFMNGDPDRPVITGRVYNDDQPIPYKSPTQSGFKTRSTPGGGPANYNEIMFEDQKGAEVFSMHAERNMATEVEVDDATTVGHDQSLTVMNDRTHTVEKNETNKIKVKQVNEIGKRQETHVGADGQKIVVDGAQESIFKDTQRIEVTKKQTVIALDDRLVDVTGFMNHKVGKNHDVDVTGFQTVSVGKDHALLVTGNTKLQSSGERTDLTAGPHTLIADKLSITAGGSDIDMFAAGNLNITVKDVNQTVLGTVKKGITGSMSSVEMGTSLKTSLSASSENKISAVLSNAIGFSCKNEIAVSIVNQISVGIENTGAAKLKNTLFSKENSAMKMFDAPGGPGGPAAATAAGGPMALAGVIAGYLSGALFGGMGIGAALLQVDEALENEAALEKERQARQQKAVTELRRLQDLARQAGTPAMDSLAGKLDALANAVRDKDVSSAPLNSLRSAGETAKDVARAAAIGMLPPGLPRI
jgi:type VI secretion system secreted protein VgrG